MRSVHISMEVVDEVSAHLYGGGGSGQCTSLWRWWMRSVHISMEVVDEVSAHLYGGGG